MLAVAGQQRTVTAHVAEDELLLGNLGLIAMPVVHPYTCKTLAILKVEDLPFLEFSQPALELMRTLCDWLSGVWALRFTPEDAAALTQQNAAE